MNPQEPVVSNAGPLMALAKLNLLHLLKDLYGRIRFSQEVYAEVVERGMQQGYDDARTLKLFLDQNDWTAEERQIYPTSQFQDAHLDSGERETLALAVHLGDALVLMDEIVGREIARQSGLKVRGTLGILIEAYQTQLISRDQIRFYLAELARREDIWISTSLIEAARREILGE